MLKYLLLVICVLILLGSFNSTQNRKGFVEGFWSLDWKGKRTDDCYSLDKDKCLLYSNCGVCNDKCIPGDKDGPYFDEYCGNSNGMWKYRDYYDEHIFGSTIDKKVEPWSKRYRDFEQVWPAPQFRSTL